LPFLPGHEDKKRLPSMKDAGFDTTLGCTNTGSDTGLLRASGVLAMA
jgi:hypothetical protein